MADERDDEYFEEYFSEASQKEKAEGSREIFEETVEEAPAHVDEGMGSRNPMERGGGQPSKPGQPLEQGTAGKEGTGITNRPRSEEERSQQRVPERGRTREEEGDEER